MANGGLNVLIAEGGGSGHALYESIQSSRQVGRTIVLPGNAGILQRDRLPLSDMKNVHEIVLAARSVQAHLVVGRSEVAQCAGLGDLCNEEGMLFFGPSKEAAKLEGSKVFAKEVMRVAGVGHRTGNYYATSNYREAQGLIRKAFLAWGEVPVIKADGLCAGKGVRVAKTLEEADAAARAALEEKTYGSAGNTILVEERLVGEELSLFYLCDGENPVPLVAARDYKRLSAEAGAPNTGGMGAFAPVPGTNKLLIEVRDQLVVPVIQEMQKRGASYHGLLYVGIMLTKNGWKVIEFNCRFGDPEAQVILPLLDCDIVPYLVASGERGGLAKLQPPRFKQGFAVCVVLADPNYGKRDAKIGGHSFHLPKAIGPKQRLFHAGTKWEDGNGLVNIGGRIFNAVGLGDTIAEAGEEAYALAKEIKGLLYYRTDIALGM